MGMQYRFPLYHTSLICVPLLLLYHPVKGAAGEQKAQVL